MVHPFRGHGHAGGDLNVNFSDQASSMRIEPIRAFDGEIMAPSIAVSLRHQLPTNVFLVECMLEKLCSVYTQTPEQQRELYEKLKNVFASLHLLPRYEGSPEMEGMRLRLGRDLNRVFLLAQRSIVTRRGQVQDGALVTSHTPLFRNLDDVVENLFNSRYESDFTEVNFIARGGFGVVFKARNKLDGNEYAIKKVIVRASSAEKIIQEVQLLSRLHHANVVAYKTAWLENSSAQTLGKIIELEEDSSSQTSSTPGARMKPSHDHLATLSSEESQDSFIVFEHGDSTSTKSVSSSLSLIRTDHSYSSQTTSSPLMLLFIQMQLCGHTLRSWLDKRNNDQDSTIHTRQLELNLFRQILQGLDYVHSKHIVHRDIKPENIFLNETCDQVRIGDFGLAKLDPSTSVFNCSDVVLRVTTSATLNKSKGVGTTSYAAPEQLDGTHYSAKSDMYSVGVVLLELLMPFRTVMERHKCISDLRELRQIPRLVDEKWPFMAGLILELTCGDPVSRPTARQVVDRLAQHSMDNDVVSNNNIHQRTIGQLQDTIDQLRRQLMEKDAKIEQLTRMVNGL